MRALEKKDLPSYRKQQQKQGRENRLRTYEENHESGYCRTLQRMVAGSRLPTTPEMRLIIKLQPVLKAGKQQRVPEEDDERSVETAGTKPLTDKEDSVEEDDQKQKQQVDRCSKNYRTNSRSQRKENPP